MSTQDIGIFIWSTNEALF